MAPARAPRVTDEDKGFGRLYTQFTAPVGQSAVFVGFLRSSGVYKPKGGKGKPITVAQLGAIHEFGAPAARIPERSFMRSSVDSGRAKIERLITRLINQVVDGMAQRRALGILGEFVKGLMQRRIQQGVPPPNRPSTIARKGSSKPLIDTGQLVNAIDWQVVTGKGAAK